MLTNVKEGRNNYHCIAHSCFYLQSWCSFSLSCSQRGGEVFCAVLFTLKHSRDWWTNNSVSVCIWVCAWRLSRLESSLSVLLMKHSEVAQWCTVKYSAVFLLSDSLRYPRTRKQQMNQGQTKEEKWEEWFHFLLTFDYFSSLIITPFFVLLLYYIVTTGEWKQGL